jgi:ketosteroid isomerase-like protein
MHPYISIANQWFEAFNRHDLEALLALYDDNASHYSPKLKIHQPETEGLIKGKAQLRAWWKDAFERLPALQYEPLVILHNEHCLFFEYLRHTPLEATMQIAEKLELRDGKIIASRVYHS